jgi:hypothetical protein
MPKAKSWYFVMIELLKLIKFYWQHTVLVMLCLWLSINEQPTLLKTNYYKAKLFLYVSTIMILHLIVSFLCANIVSFSFNFLLTSTFCYCCCCWYSNFVFLWHNFREQWEYLKLPEKIGLKSDDIEIIIKLIFNHNFSSHELTY